MSDIAAQFNTMLIKSGFQEMPPNGKFSSIGNFYCLPKSFGEGIYWIYGEKNLFLYKLLKYHLLSLVLSRAEGKYFDIFENPLAFFYIIAIMFSWARSERQGIFLWRPFYGTE